MNGSTRYIDSRQFICEKDVGTIIQIGLTTIAPYFK